MDKPIGFQLLAYSLLLAGLSYLTHHLAPSIARPSLLAGLAGAVLCLVWGVRAVMGNRSKALAVLTLLPVTFVMLSQTVIVWAGRAEVPGRRMAALVITGIFVLSLAMLMRITYAGVTFEGDAASPKKHG